MAGLLNRDNIVHQLNKLIQRQCFGQNVINLL
jgi:hypothetical protein